MTIENPYKAEIASLLKDLSLASDGDTLTLEPLPSRRYAACVRLKSGGAFFVKKGGDLKETGEIWLRHCLDGNLINPSKLYFKPQIHCLSNAWYISDFIKYKTSFQQDFDAELFAPLAPKLAKALSDFHSISQDIRNSIKTTLGSGVYAQQHVTPIGPLTLQEYAESPGLDRDLFIKTYQQSHQGLKRLMQELKLISPVHGDLHGRNILIEHAAPDKFHIVDWDRAGLGDPAWDLGMIFAALIQRWIRHADTSIASLPHLFAAAQPVWDDFSTWFADFLRTYWQEANALVEHTATTEKVALVAGHALLQRCHNILWIRGQFSQRDILTLSFAGKLLQQPVLAVSTLVPSLTEVARV